MSSHIDPLKHVTAKDKVSPIHTDYNLATVPNEQQEFKKKKYRNKEQFRVQYYSKDKKALGCVIAKVENTHKYNDNNASICAYCPVRRNLTETT